MSPRKSSPKPNRPRKRKTESGDQTATTHDYNASSAAPGSDLRAGQTSCDDSKPKNRLRSCALCPRSCGADRIADVPGRCGAAGRLKVFRSGPHHGEEPPISGTKGSGTVFFSHCTLNCLYCQNHPWSQDGIGRETDSAGLAERLKALYDAGCHNWNLVSPTPWLPWIERALEQVKNRGISLPVVYNTSGFEKPATLNRFSGCLDIALVDLRYASEATAQTASGVGNYVDFARESALWFHRRLGGLELNPDGLACRGVICRLLILPGYAEEAVENLRWLARNIGTDTYISVMAQYTPAFRAVGTPPFNRGIHRGEYDRVLGVMEELGFENGWVQEFGTTNDPDLIGYRMRSDEDS